MRAPRQKRRRLSKAAKAAIVARQAGLCALSGEPLEGQLVQFDHRLPLALGGADDLTNLQAVLVDPHKAKTRLDVKRIKKADRQRKRHLGTKKRKGRKIQSTPKIPSRGFDSPSRPWARRVKKEMRT